MTEETLQTSWLPFKEPFISLLSKENNQTYLFQLPNGTVVEGWWSSNSTSWVTVLELEMFRITPRWVTSIDRLSPHPEMFLRSPEK